MIFFESSSDSEEEQQRSNKIRRKELRDNSNIFDLPTEEFSQYFRVNKECFLMILETINLQICRSTAIPSAIQLGATLNLLASGSYEVNVGSNKVLSMAQTTVSKVFRNVLQSLEDKLCPEWIKFEEAKFEGCRKHFYEKFKLPGIVGVVDGAHIPILKPKENEHIFFNRKGFHSLNAMIICDQNNQIIAVDSTNGGAAHDSAIWNKCYEHQYLYRKYQEGGTSFRILGDSGYPLQPWLLTPYRNAPDSSPEMRFNSIHAKARSIIERTIGMLKGRWRCLCSDRRLRFSPEQVAKIVNVCAALHNICVHYKITMNQMSSSIHEESLLIPDEESLLIPDEESNAINTTPSTSNNELLRRARIIRDNIRNTL